VSKFGELLSSNLGVYTVVTAYLQKCKCANFFSHYESANKLPRKRNIDRYSVIVIDYGPPWLVCELALPNSQMESLTRRQQRNEGMQTFRVATSSIARSSYRNRLSTMPSGNCHSSDTFFLSDCSTDIESWQFSQHFRTVFRTSAFFV